MAAVEKREISRGKDDTMSMDKTLSCMFTLLRRQKKTKKKNIHSPPFFFLAVLVPCPNHSWWNEPRCRNPSHLIHWLGVSYFLNCSSMGENSNETPERKQKEREKQKIRQHVAFCSWFSSSSSWVWVRSDHILIINNPPQGSFVPRPCLQGGLGTLVWLYTWVELPHSHLHQ